MYGIHGTMTFGKTQEGVTLTKQEVYEKLKTRVVAMIITEEIGHTKDEKTGEIEEYPHFHVGFTYPTRMYQNGPPKFETELERPVWISVHAKKTEVARYVTKFDKEPMVYEWPTWKADAAKGRSERGEGTHKQKADAAWSGDIPAMKDLGMMPNEVSKELNAVPLVEEVRMKDTYRRKSNIDLSFVDYKNNKSIDIDVNMDKQLLTIKGRKTPYLGRRGVWVYGETRTGKTHQAAAMIEKHDGYRCDDPRNFDGYGCQQLIMLNDMDPTHFPSPSEFRRFIDSARYNRKYGSKQVDPNDVFFIVTSNYSIRELWGIACGDMADKYRRSIDALVEVFIEIKLVGKYQVEGMVTYGSAHFSPGRSDSEEDQPVKKVCILQNIEMYTEARKKIIEGDTNYHYNVDTGVYTRDVEYGVEELRNGRWFLRS